MYRFKFSALFLGAITMTVLFIPATHAAEGQGVYSAGEPEVYDLPTDNTVGFADIYTRQLAYRLEANKLRAQILDRQKHFQAPAMEARAQYEQNILDLNENRGSTEIDKSIGESQ